MGGRLGPRLRVGRDEQRAPELWDLEQERSRLRETRHGRAARLVGHVDAIRVPVGPQAVRNRRKCARGERRHAHRDRGRAGCTCDRAAAEAHRELAVGRRETRGLRPVRAERDPRRHRLRFDVVGREERRGVDEPIRGRGSEAVVERARVVVADRGGEHQREQIQHCGADADRNRRPPHHRSTNTLASTWVSAGAVHDPVTARCHPSSTPAARSSGRIVNP